MINNQKRKIKAYLAGVNLKNDPSFDYEMTELRSLAEADNLEVVGVSTQKLDELESSSYFGLGKVNEIRTMARGLKAKALVLNDELSPVQIRNLEQMTRLRVIDRTELILEIFSGRARTRQAKLQVALARLEYELPRLHPSDNPLAQQRGGGFANRGAGESKLEINRRTIARRIANIKKDLRSVAKHEQIKSARRNQSSIPKVALVGYTNAGKSTTMNGLIKQFDAGKTDKEVFTKNMLFATLDTSVRRIDLSDSFSFILSDTVGFISKLPHNLVESFKATLQEARDADLLINVVDASDPNMVQMIRTTEKTLAAIGAEGIPTITAYNKADLTRRGFPQVEGSDILYSAQDPASIRRLAQLIVSRIFAGYRSLRLFLPLTAGKELAYLHAHAQVTRQRYGAKGILVEANIAPADQKRFAKFRQQKSS